jgi:Spy/CpxP family protein refolding chaperone
VRLIAKESKMKRVVIIASAALLLAGPALAQGMGGGMMGGGMTGGYGGSNGSGPYGGGRDSSGGYGAGPGMMGGNGAGTYGPGDRRDPFDGLNLSAGQRTKIARIQDELAREARKRIDAVLTPQQREQLRRNDGGR